MYLKQIVASGFKSFADKLDIKLDDKTTCIVGPNGSGKSNVVDAVRWVLGEQSVKSLRGDGSMSDVIFSGSKSRNPLNVASVELVFDNSDNFINVPYTDISIKRRVYRSGENEYFLNGEQCRLKDLTNLLMDSGMSKESFNIISQGEVERILSSSPTDRRIIFEEAANILKYKKRKNEALRKLDRTHNNLDRLNDIITELERQIDPLKEQSKKAREYLENKKGLDNYEVALLAYDIEDNNNKLNYIKNEKEKIDKEILNISTSVSKNDAEYIEDANNLEKLEKKQRDLNQQLLDITEEVERLNGERKLLKERNKNNGDTKLLNESITDILEEKEKISSSILVKEEELKDLVKKAKKEEEEANLLNIEINKLKTTQNMLNTDYSNHSKNIVSTTHEVESLKKEIDLGGDLPNSVRSVLNANSLSGIYNTIGNVLATDEKYVKALNIAISACKNFIITKDEISAKYAVSYLKDNHLGRATFFPISVIKDRYIDKDSLKLLKEDNSFLGVLSDLVQYDKKYENIIKNQLGIVLVTTDMDSATKISQLIKRRYKVVTLDGDVVNVGGSISGGSLYKSKSIISLKQDLKYKQETLELLKQELKEIDEQLQDVSKQILTLQEKDYAAVKSKVNLKEKYDAKKQEIASLKISLKEADDNWNSLEAIKNNSFDKKEQQLIEDYYKANASKESISKQLISIDDDIAKLKSKIEEKTANEKLHNAKLRNLEKQSREKEILINRLDVKIDNMLSILSDEYELTFEKAKEDYNLDINPEDARVKVNTYRANIKRIGMVNLDAIDEYEKVNTRYMFLTNQREDLLKAEDTLLEIMNEMDSVMKDEFKTTFQRVQKEFRQVFKELFGGGSADLKLTDPDNMLTTGVEIVASPPGKKLTTVSLLSGGEKTLTAISLLFAILNVRVVPFCLFDEVEAALDEANVDKFGKYLDHYKNKTQFLIITHKKKTMEYANTLYGITMQESGVSKLVSVRLNEKNK